MRVWSLGYSPERVCSKACLAPCVMLTPVALPHLINKETFIGCGSFILDLPAPRTMS